jgi:2-C-methyl-D-erythritol 4-phosphate cytidylyltransferase
MRTIAIVPAAGSGKRLGLKVKKPFVPLGGKPLVSHAIRAFESTKEIDGIIIAAEPVLTGRFRVLVKRCGFRKVIAVVAGGRTRFESVGKCLAKVPASAEVVLIHDGARPFPEKRLISGAVKAARRYGACVTAVPETDTVKLVDTKGLFVRKTLDRRVIYRAQTPQAFSFTLLKKAYAKAAKAATDDSSLVEALGKKVKVLEGSCRNIKVTTREDLRIARALL